MRILIVTQFWEPDEGPPHWRLRRFVDALIKAGHVVDVLTPPPHHPTGTLTSDDPLHGPGAVDAREPDITVRRTRFREHGPNVVSRIADQLVVTASTIARGLRLGGSQVRPDVVIATVPAVPSAFAAAALSARYRCRLVVDLRDAWPDLIAYVSVDGPAAPGVVRRAEELAVSAVGRIARSALTAVLTRADLVITTSDWLGHRLAEEGISHVATIRNSPVGPGALDPRTGPARPGPPARELRLLYAGTVGRAQGLSNAVEAVGIAASQGHRVVFRVVGAGAELGEVRELAAALDAPVDFNGPVTHDQIVEHYNWCDASLVHLRDWGPLERTIPSKLFECMARGIPVIAATNGESAEIVDLTAAGASVPAMDPQSLADLLVNWSKFGVPPVDKDAVSDWLALHADPGTTAAEFVRLVEDTGFLAPRGRLQLGERTARTASLVRYAFEVGRDDPVHLATLVGRRLPPGARQRITRLSTAAAPEGALRGLAHLIGDERHSALDEYAHARPGRLRDMLGLHLQKSVGGSPYRNFRARRAWDLGDMTGAIRVVRSRTITARRWKAIARVLEDGFDPKSVSTTRIRLAPTGITALQSAAACDDPAADGHRTRVLHVLTNSLPHTQSGYTVRSHSILTSQRRAGLTVAATTRLGYPESIGVSTAAPADIVDGITYVRFPDMALPSTLDERLARSYRVLLDAVSAFQPDVLHTTTNFENGLVTRAVSRRTGIPWVYETRGEMEQTWLSRHSAEDYDIAAASEYYRALRSVETRLMTDADAVIALSRVQKSSHISRGVDPMRITVIPNSVDDDVLALLPAASSVARVRHGLPEAFTVGTVSSLVDYEGLDTLLQAIAILRAEGREIRGLIVGDGAARPDLESLTDRLGLTGIVDFPGKVPIVEVIGWYDAIDVFCIPRKDLHVTRSVTPIKPLQAMARRRPLVVSDLDALTEITTDSGAGLTVPAEDPKALARAIRGLHDDPALYARCAEAGRLSAESTSWENSAVRYAELYSQIARR